MKLDAECLSEVLPYKFYIRRDHESEGFEVCYAFIFEGEPWVPIVMWCHFLPFTVAFPFLDRSGLMIDGRVFESETRGHGASYARVSDLAKHCGVDYEIADLLGKVYVNRPKKDAS